MENSKPKFKLAHKITLGVLFVLIVAASAIIIGSPKAPVAELSKSQRDSVELRERINKQFSEWDGSHREVEKLVKSNLHDPKSFEHVETTFKVLNADTMFVVMVYRAKNAFGGVVTEQVRANVSTANGSIIDVLE